MNNEAVIAALMTHHTRKATAAALGISERSLYNIMQKDDFVKAYKAARRDLLTGAVDELQTATMDAIKAILEIMKNPDNAAGIRLTAANSILAHADKMAGRLQAQENNFQGPLDTLFKWV